MYADKDDILSKFRGLKKELSKQITEKELQDKSFDSLREDWVRNYTSITINGQPLKTLKGSENQTRDFFDNITEDQLKQEVMSLCLVNFTGSDEEKQQFQAHLMSKFHQDGLLGIPVMCLSNCLAEHDIEIRKAKQELELTSTQSGCIINYTSILREIGVKFEAEKSFKSLDESPVVLGLSKIEVSYQDRELEHKLISNDLDYSAVEDKFISWDEIPEQWSTLIRKDLKTLDKLIVENHFSPKI